MSYGTTELPYTAARIKGIIKATGQITVKPAGLAGIQLDCNGATGDFTASITPANLTGNRRWILPDRDDTFAGLGAQTFTGIQLITNPAASTTTTTGALVVTGGVGVGGRLNVGSTTIIGTDPGGSELLRVGGGARFNNSFVITGASPVPVLNSTAATDATTSAYFSFQRNAAEKGWLGYGDAVSGLFKITNNIGDIRLAPSGQVIIGTDPGGAEVLRVGGALAVNSATLIKTNTTLTDGAAAAVGTLTNAPTAGNPTKWVLINDNGVIRKFPTWT